MIWMLLPLLLGLVLAEQRCRRQFNRLLRLMPDVSYRNRIGARLLPDILILIALTLILLSLQPTQPTAHDSGSAPAIALVVDVSQSMQVADVQPNRLTLAKRELLALISRLPDARFALIPFAGEAVLQVPLTSDRAGLKFFINNLHPGLIASKGSAPEEAVLLAQRSLETIKGERLIVLLTDGERTIADPPPPLSSTIPVYSIMLGTTAGGEVDHTNGAISQAETQRLTAITRQTGGKRLKGNLSSPAVFDLPIKQTTAEKNATNNPFLIIALFLTVLRWAPTTLPTGRIFGLTLLVTVLLPLGCDNAAQQILQPRVHFDSGMQAADNKEFESALEAFSLAAEGLDDRLLGITLYNRGTLLLETGQTAKAIILLEQAMILMPGDEIVRDNLLLALAQPGMFTNDGSGTPNRQEADKGDEMSAQQAQQLIDSVRLDPTAPPIEATIRPPTVLKEW